MNASLSVSRAIDRQIKADQKRMKKEVKLLLLGIFFSQYIESWGFCQKTHTYQKVLVNQANQLY